ncbi:erythromycin esterase [Kitasatospora sp. MMS16-BH015]|uniref:erythromycin esterase family protein n=1 Tax=Kitasatospora sp. MMS16-BH015 TaxID=2018025 RepID=UPI000CA0C566|nr:erythromycin esterase family protein [Kitasatospora sp. MMS16-BH015]AUG75660.1 erythromycin esterase [Kitasatospora sp. MMS16-BH015]
MTAHHHPGGRRRALATVVLAITAALAPAVAQATPAAAAPAGHGTDAVVRALDRAAHPLRSTEPGGGTADLRALRTTIGDAKVVGLGEATHGSHEFFAMKERVFRDLVEHQGFTTFALEVSWSAGLRIDDYLQTGKGGDARTVAKAALAGSPWDREEFVSLITWMREYNLHHRGRTVHFLGDDLGAPSLDDAFFARITDYVQGVDPQARATLDTLYTGLRPIDDALAYLTKPLAERRSLAARAQQALDLVTGLRATDREAAAWARQNARSVAETTSFLSLDPGDTAALPAFERFRDEVMARNVTWWQQHTGAKVLLSAHDDHVGRTAGDPQLYPKTQGAFLTDTMGRDYLPIGFTFHQGSLLSKDTAIGGDWKEFTAPPPAPDTNEYTLDQVHHRDFYLDLRTAPPLAKAWLSTPRPTRTYGTQYPYPPGHTALAESYDVLIHLHTIHAATPTP